MPDGMRATALADLATITMGQSPESAALNSSGRGLPFLQGCAEFGARSPSARIHCSPPLRVAKAGSVLISVRAPVGSTNRADRDYCIGRGLGAAVARPGLADNNFLLSAIQHGIGYLHRRSQGSTFLAIASSDLHSMPIAAPELDAQQRIAEVLSTVDEAIEQTEALIAKTQQIKAGLMHACSPEVSPRTASFGRRAMRPGSSTRSPSSGGSRRTGMLTCWTASRREEAATLPIKVTPNTGTGALSGFHWQIPGGWIGCMLMRLTNTLVSPAWRTLRRSCSRQVSRLTLSETGFSRLLTLTPHPASRSERSRVSRS